MFFATARKSSIRVESLMFSAKCRECKIEKRDGHGKLRNGHGKVMVKYFVKSVGALSWDIYILSKYIFVYVGWL